MTVLLISGSQKASDQMRYYAYKAVIRAKVLGYDIVVGDAEGINTQVIRICNEFGVYYDCFGVTEAPRCPNCSLSNYQRIDIGGSWKKRFLGRDRHMAELADIGLFIWNGTSGGTIYTYKYMMTLNKKCWLKNFGEEFVDER